MIGSGMPISQSSAPFPKPMSASIDGHMTDARAQAIVPPGVASPGLQLLAQAQIVVVHALANVRRWIAADIAAGR